MVPRPSAPRPKELGESSTQVPHGKTSPRRSTRLISRSEHALVCLVWALPCQVLSPSQNAMVQNCPSVCMVSRPKMHPTHPSLPSMASKHTLTCPTLATVQAQGSWEKIQSFHPRF